MSEETSKEDESEESTLEEPVESRHTIPPQQEPSFYETHDLTFIDRDDQAPPNISIDEREIIYNILNTSSQAVSRLKGLAEDSPQMQTERMKMREITNDIVQFCYGKLPPDKIDGAFFSSLQFLKTTLESSNNPILKKLNTFPKFAAVESFFNRYYVNLRALDAPPQSNSSEMGSVENTEHFSEVENPEPLRTEITRRRKYSYLNESAILPEGTKRRRNNKDIFQPKECSTAKKKRPDNI